MSNIFKAMQPKKKRPVDPNAPPRPNLMSHDKVIRDLTAKLEQFEDEVVRLRRKVDELERKHVNQNAFVGALYNQVKRK